MKKIILFGAGFYGQGAYFKMKEQFEILYFADNNLALAGTKLFGIPVIAGQQLREVYSSETDVIICAQAYFEISAQLIEMGITDYYVMLEGFLYHSNKNETMMPVELNQYNYFCKRDAERTILYVQSTECAQLHKMAAMMGEEGYKVFLLYTMACPQTEDSHSAGVYDGIFTFYTVNGIVDFIENSDFDIVHSFDDSDVLTNIVLLTPKHVVVNADRGGQKWVGTVENLVLSYMADARNDGMADTSLDSKGLVEFYESVKKRNVMR